MSSDSRPLSHLLYTNAPGEGDGFRLLTFGFPGTQTEKERIQGWLMGLHLAGEQQTGWAASSFEIKRTPCFALAIVDRTTFVVDDIGRPGILTHALLVLLEEGKPLGDFGLALLDQARKFLENPPTPPTLEKYIAGCQIVDTLSVPKLDRYNNFRGIDPGFLEAFYSAASSFDSRQGATVLFPGYTSDKDLPEHLLSASTTLPPRLRLGLSWRVGLQETTKEALIARVAPMGSVVPIPRNGGTAYLETVREFLEAGQDSRVAEFAANAWEVRTWSGLLDAFGRPAAADQIESSGFLAEAEDETDMAKRKGSSGAGGKSDGTPRAKSPAAYDEEYQALQKDLEDYLNEQLTLLGAPPARRATPSPFSMPGRDSSWGARHSVLRWYREWRPEVYFLILLLVGGVAFSKLRPPDPAEPSPKDPSSVVQPPLEPDPDKPDPDEPDPDEPDPDEPVAVRYTDWKTFAGGPEAVDWFQAVSEARGLASNQVSPLRKGDFKRWAERLKRQPLAEADLASSRIASFEYVHALWAKGKGIGRPAEDVVTLDPSEAALHLKQMVADLGLTATLGSNPQINDEGVQAAVVLAWIQRPTGP